MSYYLLIINLLAGVVFAYDKHCARVGNRRVPEFWLHVCELAGGVFAVLLLMYVIRHKNRKFSYFIVTYILFLLWLALAVVKIFNIPLF